MEILPVSDDGVSFSKPLICQTWTLPISMCICSRPTVYVHLSLGYTSLDHARASDLLILFVLLYVCCCCCCGCCCCCYCHQFCTRRLNCTAQNVCYRCDQLDKQMMAELKCLYLRQLFPVPPNIRDFCLHVFKLHTILRQDLWRKSRGQKRREGGEGGIERSGVGWGRVIFRVLYVSRSELFFFYGRAETAP